MTVFAVSAELPILKSEEDIRELCDLTIQRYLDLQPEGDERAIDNAEDSILYLELHSDMASRDYDTGPSMLRRLALVRTVGAGALRKEDHPILSRPGYVRKTRVKAEKAVDANEALAANMLDDTIIDLLTDGKIDDMTAQGLMLLFQLRESPNPYSSGQRDSLSVVTQGFYSTLQLAMKDKPTVRRKKTRALCQVELQDGMELFNILNELLKVPETRTQHPLNIYLDSRSRSSKASGGKHQVREATLSNAHFIIREAFGIDHHPTNEGV